jgi:hypothetical protein
MSEQAPLLRRVSEEAEDPRLFPEEVHRLHEEGRASAALKALRKHITTERNAARKDKQVEYAEDPYLWLEPVNSPPSLGTLNGIGARLYGTHKPDGHGHYISVHYATIVYVPVFPLGAYVVEDAPGGGWFFLAKAPLPLWANVWRLVFGAGVAVGVAAAAFTWWQDHSRVDVVAYNGHDVALAVSVGDDTRRVGPFGTARFDDLEAGATVFAASLPEGAEIDRHDVDLSDDAGDEVIYNVNGRGVLEMGWTRYGPGNPPDGRMFGTEAVQRVPDIDYVFRSMPDELSVSSSRSYEDRSWLDDAAKGAPFGAVYGYLLDNSEAGDAQALVEAELEVHPDGAEPLNIALSAVIGDAVATRAFLDARLEAQPGSVQLHRYWQDHVGGADQDATRERYKARAEANPESADNWYLYGRSAEGDAISTAYGKALSLEPDHTWTHGALGWQALMASDFATAREHMAASTGDDASRVVDQLRPRLMVERLALGAPWGLSIEALLAEARRAGASSYDVELNRATHLAAAGDPDLDGILAYFKTTVERDDGEPLSPETVAFVRLFVAHAGGDTDQINAALSSLAERMPEASAVASGSMLVALGDGGDRSKVAAALATLEVDQNAAIEDLILRGAASVHVGGDVEAAWRGRLGGVAPAPDPTTIFDPELDLQDLDAVEQRIAGINPFSRGYAWAAVAIMLDAEGEAGSPVARLARKEAQRWSYPGALPVWQ